MGGNTVSESSKFFTPPLSASDHATLLRVMGIDAINFHFIERAGNLTLQHWWQEDGKRQVLLTDEFDPQAPTLRLDHGANGVLAYPMGVPSTLLEELLPFPLSLYSRLVATPATFTSELAQLWTAFKNLEEAVGRTEVCCVWFENSENSFPLLTHSVRRKRVRMGTDPGLSQLRTLHQENGLTAAALRDHFGTHAAFIPVILRELGLPNAIRQGLSSYVGPTSPTLEYGEIDLNLDLGV